MRHSVFCLAVAALLAAPSAALAQADDWDVTLPRGETRMIDFETDEGTWTSLDVSPDGTWIVFDLLAHIYRVPATGGEAELLTRDAGVSVNVHPRYSPDGSRIVFVSDRGGQNNLWVMDADGGNPRAVEQDQDVRANAPTWTADGRFIVYERQPLPRPGQQASRGLWMVHVDGGTGVELTSVAGASWPSIDRGGRHLYFTRSTGSGGAVGYSDAIKGYRQVARYDLETGQIVPITSGTAGQQVRASSGGGYAAEVSPDGRYVAFARRIPDGLIEWKGHVYGPRTALWLRDLETGSERVLADPIESDMVETIKTLRPIPGYAWTPDSRAIVLNQGGKIRRIDVADGSISTVEFTARVQREISEQTRASFRISDDAFEARFTRWHAPSPDGRTFAFQAVGKIWLVPAAGGTPRRLTADSFEPMEYAPSWSPDGNHIAFTTWEEPAEGHVWRVAVSRGAPQRLSETSGEYIHPVWSPDGNSIVVARGAGATQRHRTWAWNPWHDLVRIPAQGGPAEFVVKENTGRDGTGAEGARQQIVRASFAEDRMYYPEAFPTDGGPTWSALASVALDGSDHRVHATFPFADEVVVSPDGRHIAFQEGDNVYVTPFPLSRSGGEPVHITKRGGALPVEQLSTEGGLFPTWIDPDRLSFGSAQRIYVHDLTTSATDTTDVSLRVPRALSTRSIALTNARIVTLEDEAQPNGAAGVLETRRRAHRGRPDRVRGVARCL